MDPLHDRIAKALGWSERDVRSMSMQTLRELVRPVDPDLAAEMSHVIRSGEYIRGAARRGRRGHATIAEARDLKTLYNDLSEASRAALKTAGQSKGYLVAGTTVIAGRLVRTNASTLRSLEKRGIVQLRLSNEGGMSAQLTALGEQLVAYRAALGSQANA